VKVTFDGAGPGAAPSREVTVTVRGLSAPQFTESGPLDDSGRYLPRRSLADQAVCVDPPSGWTVRSPHTEERDGRWCTTEAVKDAAADVEFGLVRT
jgi:hypothetical protein